MKRCHFSTVSNHSNQYICQIVAGTWLLLSWSMLETCIVKENVQYKAQDIYKYIASSLPSFDNFLQLLLHRHGGPTAPEPAVARFSPSIVVVTFKSFFFPREGKLFHADISSPVLESKRYRPILVVCVQIFI